MVEGCGVAVEGWCDECGGVWCRECIDIGDSLGGKVQSQGGGLVQ